jgi:hypothetical protein
MPGGPVTARTCLASVFAAALVLSSPTLSHAQTARASSGNACTKKAAADSGKVILNDSTAPIRWDKPTRDRVSRHEACLGMTTDMLVKSWGMPKNITDQRTETDTTSEFFYKGATVVLVNRVVRAIRPPAHP